MKRTRFTLCMALVLLLLLSLSPLAFAETAVSGSDASASGYEDGSVFLAGKSTSSSAQVNGILFSAANDVSADGKFEFAMLAGNEVAVSGACEKDAFLAGRSVTVTGSTGRDLYIAAQVISIEAPIARDLFAMGETVVLGSYIGGDVYLNANTIVIKDGVSIGGSVRYNSNAKITAPESILAKAETYEAKTSSASSAGAEAAAPKAPTTFDIVKDKAFPFLGLLLLAYALLWLTALWETVDARFDGVPFGRYAAAFGIGVAVLVILPIAAILLMVTGFGLRPAFVLLLVYCAVMVGSPLFLSFFLGRLLWRRLFKQKANYWLELAFGLILWRLLTLVPYLSAGVSFVALPLALGTATLLLGKKKKARKAPEVPVPVADLPAEQ